MIPDGVEVTYRYAVCMFVPTICTSGGASVDEKVIVRRWETNLKPRKIACHGKLFSSDSIQTVLMS